MSVTWSQPRGGYEVRAAIKVDGKVRDKRRLIKARRGETKREALRRSKAVEVELFDKLRSERVSTTATPNPTFEEFVETYLEHCTSLRNRQGKNNFASAGVKRSLIGKQLVPFFGSVRVAQISQADINAFTEAQEAATYTRGGITRRYAPTYISTQLKRLGHMLRVACDLGIREPAGLPVIQMSKAVPLRRAASKGRLGSDEFFTPEEASGIIAAASHDGPMWKAMAMLLLRAGPRVGEALGLRWEDIDFERGVLGIERQFSYGKVRPPKTGPRQVPLHDSVLAALSDIPRTSPRWLFPGRAGSANPLRIGPVRHHGKGWAERAGIDKGFRPHMCRHTAASHFLASGVPPHIAAEWLGHSTATLLQVYAHVAPNESFARMRALDFDSAPGLKVAT